MHHYSLKVFKAHTYTYAPITLMTRNVSMQGKNRAEGKKQMLRLNSTEKSSSFFMKFSTCERKTPKYTYIMWCVCTVRPTMKTHTRFCENFRGKSLTAIFFTRFFLLLLLSRCFYSKRWGRFLMPCDFFLSSYNNEFQPILCMYVAWHQIKWSTAQRWRWWWWE